MVTIFLLQWPASFRVVVPGEGCVMMTIFLLRWSVTFRVVML